MKQMIGFAYLRTVNDLNEENVYELYACADYCGILKLMDLCVNYIISLLNPENCVDIMLFAR